MEDELKKHLESLGVLKGPGSQRDSLRTGFLNGIKPIYESYKADGFTDWESYLLISHGIEQGSTAVAVSGVSKEVTATLGVIFMEWLLEWFEENTEAFTDEDEE